MLGSQLIGFMGMIGAVTTIGLISMPVMAQSRDTNPLCYFIDANGYRQDLSNWCGQPRALPITAVPSNSSATPLERNPVGGSTNSSDKFTLVNCRVEDENPNDRNPLRRPIVHLVGQVRNLTGRSAQNVTIRYIIRSGSTILDRRGQVINEPVLAADAVGVFDRKDQPIAIERVNGSGVVDRQWRVEVESIEWMASGQRMTYTLPEAQPCSNLWLISR